MKSSHALKRLNIEVKDLPLEVNRVLNILSTIKGIKKSEIIREALIEYAEKHNPQV